MANNNTYTYSMETVSDHVLTLPSVKECVANFETQLKLVRMAEKAEDQITAAKANFESDPSNVTRKALDDVMALAGTLKVRREELRKKVLAANTEIANCVFSYMVNSDTPAHDALSLGKIPAYRYTNGKEGSDVESSPAWIDLLKMQEYAKCNIGNKVGWHHAIEILARDMLAQAKAEIRIDDLSSPAALNSPDFDLPDYDIGSDAEKYEKEIGRKKVPGSTRDIVERLQEVVDKIVFVPTDSDPALNSIKVLNKDAKFFKKACIRDGGDLALTGKRGAAMRNLVYRIIHRIVNHLEFNVTYSVKK